MSTTVYDVTTFPTGVSCYDDLGVVINAILAQVKSQQTTQTTRPGAVIYIPPGHYTLRTQVVIDVSFVQIKGSGHGFLSQAVRDEPGRNVSNWVETLPGASHVIVANQASDFTAFLVKRNGSPETVGRLNGIEFRDFMINGGGAGAPPYLPGTGKTGIKVDSDSDSLLIDGMGFAYLSHAMVIRGADAAAVTGCFIAECGNCLLLTGASQVVKITDNYLISSWAGVSIFAEGAEGLNINGNTLVWHGAIRLKDCSRGSITGNKFVSSWPGMIVMESPCHENLIGANHFRRVTTETSRYAGAPDDLFGMIQVRGNGNSITGNHFSLELPNSALRPAGAFPSVILVKAGRLNLVSANQITRFPPDHTTNSSFTPLDWRIVLDTGSTLTKVLYSAPSANVTAYSTSYTHVPIP